jgi:hypothetical protein
MTWYASVRANVERAMPTRSRRALASLGAALGMLATGAGPCTAQSLGEAARKAREERSSKPASSAPTYTDEDLAERRAQAARTAGTPAPTPTSSPTPEASPVDVPSGLEPQVLREQVPLPPGETDSEPLARQEAFWRARAESARSRVAQAEERLAAAAQRAQDKLASCGLDARRARARAEGAVERAQAELDASRQALADLDDEARRAGALPGWLR